MVSGAGLKAVAAAGVLAAAAGGAVIARADDSSGRAAQAGGGLGDSADGSTGATLTVDSPRAGRCGAQLQGLQQQQQGARGDGPARPWTQSSSGVVSPNRRGTLGGVTVSEGYFTLAPGASKDITVTLARRPVRRVPLRRARGRRPPDRPRQEQGRRHRLPARRARSATTPPTATYGLKAGAAKCPGTGSKQTLTLSRAQHRQHDRPGDRLGEAQGPVRDQERDRQGDADPARQERRGRPRVTEQRCAPGSYTATVTLIQNKQKTTLTKRSRCAERPVGGGAARRAPHPGSSPRWRRVRVAG